VRKPRTSAVEKPHRGTNILYEAAHPRYPGIEPAWLRFNFTELIRQKDELIAYYRDKKYQSIVGGRISVVEGSARFVDRNAVEGDVRLEAERFLVATGSRPFHFVDKRPGQRSVHDKRPYHQ
jgi:pyruvate/2-oxoglutarate dehydrogenase complex dihydrolipoamide dehydrogenase (E3) component